MAKARLTTELSLAAPVTRGLFPAVIGTANDEVVVDGKALRRPRGWSEARWSNSDRTPVEHGITSDWYHVLDMSGTALAMLRWYDELEKDARLVAYAHAGVEPQLMGLGPIPAVKRVFEKAGLKPADMDVVESNEAFAVQAMAVTKDLGLDPARVNPNGGAVALGHPIGATGCILTVKALYELERTRKRYALVTMCIGGGQGIAAIFERI
jgi:acetyl-CoA acetyltransferase